jgi:ADP-ribose pyrophosphatase
MPQESIVFRADRYNVARVTYQTATGEPHQRDVVRHPGAVVVVPVLSDGSIVMIENYRPSVDRKLLEIPAGTMEPGEPAADSAARELAEETGYLAGRLAFLRTFYASPGICDEAMHLFLATELTASDPQREAYEEIENVVFTSDQSRQMIADGKIEDGKTLIGLMHYLWLGG